MGHETGEGEDDHPDQTDWFLLGQGRLPPRPCLFVLRGSLIMGVNEKINVRNDYAFPCDVRSPRLLFGHKAGSCLRLYKRASNRPGA